MVVVGHGVGVLWSAMTMPFASIEDYTAPEPKELHGGRWLGGGVCYKQLTDRSRIANSTSGGNQRDDTFQRGPRSALPLLRPPRMPFAFLQRAKSPRHAVGGAWHGMLSALSQRLFFPKREDGSWKSGNISRRARLCGVVAACNQSDGRMRRARSIMLLRGLGLNNVPQVSWAGSGRLNMPSVSSCLGL